jgi:hypothetical protein
MVVTPRRCTSHTKVEDKCFCTCQDVVLVWGTLHASPQCRCGEDPTWPSESLPGGINALKTMGAMKRGIVDLAGTF